MVIVNTTYRNKMYGNVFPMLDSNKIDSEINSEESIRGTKGKGPQRNL